MNLLDETPDKTIQISEEEEAEEENQNELSQCDRSADKNLTFLNNKNIKSSKIRIEMIIFFL